VSAPAAPAAGSLVRGGGVLAVATLATNAGNYVLNLLLGRWLSPAEFADATLMVRLMLTLTAAALCLQLVAARFVGRDPGGSGLLVARLRRQAWTAGAVLGLALAAPAVLWQQVFHTASPWPFVVLGVGIPCYLAQSVGRGVLQGGFRFTRLSASLVVEMVVRLAGGLAGVALGYGVLGATAGLTLSFVATWLVVRAAEPADPADGGPDHDRAEVRAYAASVGLLMVGQIVLTNGDLLVAKAHLDPDEAGVYSAVALVGRAVFFVSWAATTVAFPAAARRHAAGLPTGRLLVVGGAAVAALGLACALAALLAGGPVLGVLLGPVYAGVSVVLAEYAVITTMFAVANFVASHHLSTGRTRESWLLLGGAVLQTALLLASPDSIAALVRAQLVAVSVLLVAVLAAQLTGRSAAPRPTVQEVSTP
jgi:O-antigen/teichoic acid export membrane protein